VTPVVVVVLFVGVVYGDPVGVLRNRRFISSTASSDVLEGLACIERAGLALESKVIDRAEMEGLGLSPNDSTRPRPVIPTEAALSARVRGIPNRCSSSSKAGLPSRDRLVRTPPRFPFVDVWMDVRGASDRDKLVSKQSGHEGRPIRSTMGWLPMFFAHPSQLKQDLWYTRLAVSTNPPSRLRIRTGRWQVWQSPLDPPFVTKQGLHRYRPPGDEEAEAEGSGYIVASGANVEEHKWQQKLARDSFGWRTEPYTFDSSIVSGSRKMSVEESEADPFAYKLGFCVKGRGAVVASIWADTRELIGCDKEDEWPLGLGKRLACAAGPDAAVLA
jgi:hypothetical protein